MTDSNGEKTTCVVEETDRLKFLQTKLSRQQIRSNNYNKTLMRIKAEYEHIVNKKNDISNKLVNRLKQYAHIVIQDEQIRAWHSTGHGKAV